MPLRYLMWWLRNMHLVLLLVLAQLHIKGLFFKNYSGRKILGSQKTFSKNTWQIGNCSLRTTIHSNDANEQRELFTNSNLSFRNPPQVRHLLEHQHQQQHHHHHHHHHQPLMSAPPVNFRTSPPLEALKPHRGHIIQRSTTPLILTESGRGLEHIRISSSSSISSTTSSLSSLGGASVGTVYGGGIGGLPTCDSPAALPSGLSNHHHHQHHHQAQNSSNNLALLSTTNTPTGAPATPVGMPFIGQEPPGAAAIAIANMEISRSVSPPAKVFHCAVSPRRRQSRHQQQRMPRPHRPCLDFDKMQQVSIYKFDAIPNSRFRKCVAMWY